jgi:hypothetical protein
MHYASITQALRKHYASGTQAVRSRQALYRGRWQARRARRSSCARPFRTRNVSTARDHGAPVTRTCYSASITQTPGEHCPSTSTAQAAAENAREAVSEAAHEAAPGAAPEAVPAAGPAQAPFLRERACPPVPVPGLSALVRRGRWRSEGAGGHGRWRARAPAGKSGHVRAGGRARLLPDACVGNRRGRKVSGREAFGRGPSHGKGLAAVTGLLS